MSNTEQIIIAYGLETRVYDFIEGRGYGCAECCTGDRCDEDCTAKYKGNRKNCPHCKGRGRIPTEDVEVSTPQPVQSVEEGFTKMDLHFIESALNHYWNDAHTNLERKDLGDLEKIIYEKQLSSSKYLMGKTESILINKSPVQEDKGEQWVSEKPEFKNDSIIDLPHITLKFIEVPQTTTTAYKLKDLLRVVFKNTEDMTWDYNWANISSWNVLCTYPDISEEQAAKVVGETNTGMYENFTDPQYYHSTALESFHSLLTAHNIDTTIRWAVLYQL